MISPIWSARCGVTLARQGGAHNVNLAEVDGGYALGMKNFCYLNIMSRFTVCDTKKGASEPASRGRVDRPEIAFGHATEVKKTPRFTTGGSVETREARRVTLRIRPSLRPAGSGPD